MGNTHFRNDFLLNYNIIASGSGGTNGEDKAKN